MWPFKKKPVGPKEWLTLEQAQRVVRIYYRDRDIGCWFACAATDDEMDTRVATSTEEEARDMAEQLANEVWTKTGRRLPVDAPKQP